MQSDILNPRRAPRVPVRCEVEIRHRFTSWTGETEDIGPGGCQILSPRAVPPGREVKLAIRCDAIGRTIGASGKVVWWRSEAPSRLGVAFGRRVAGKGWFEALVKRDPALERAARSVPDRLTRPTRIYLGRPPQLVVDFTPTELEILRRVGPGLTLDALARSFGAEMHERTRGALFALVARRFLVFDRGSSAGVAPWASILPDRAAEDAWVVDAAERARASRRLVEAQRLYDEALGHIGAGRLGLAVDRLRDAMRLAPEDKAISATAKRIARWV